jgi:glycerol-3-phosphate cytidylyltransferase
VIVYTGGTFDLFHAGHALLLQRCRALAGPDGRVVVALNTDDFIESYKGTPPTIPYVEREVVLLACRYVDEVIPNVGGHDSKPAVEIVRPDLIVIGDDWAPGKGKDYMAQMGFDDVWLGLMGVDILYLPKGWDARSSDIRAKL